MKVKKQLYYFYLILGFLLILISCSKENEIVEQVEIDDFILCEDEGFKNDSTLNCGCDSKVSHTIDAEDSTSRYYSLSEGVLSKVDSSESYMINFRQDDGISFTHFICNNSCVSSFFDNSTSTEVEVVFSGKVKGKCNSISPIPEGFSSLIIITKINRRWSNEIIFI